MMKEYPNLPLIQERFWNAIKDLDFIQNTKYYPEFEVYVFPQTWGSTALGFGGIGGQAITSAYTTVIEELTFGIWGVFFGNRLADVIESPNDSFLEDLRRGNMSDYAMAGKYRRKDL